MNQRHLFAQSLACALLVLLVGCGDPKPDASPSVADSLLADSMVAAIERVKTPGPTQASDRAELRRWTELVVARADSILAPQTRRASTLLKRALEAYRLLGDSAGVGTTLGLLGEANEERSRYSDALALNERALARSRAAGDRSAVATHLHEIGDVHRKQGRYDEALSHYRSAADMRRELGDQDELASTLNNIGLVFENRGQFEKAADRYATSLSIKREIGDRKGVASTLNNLGIVHAIQGEFDQALAHWNRSLSIKRQLGDREGVATTLNNLGNIYEDQGRFSRALTHFRDALDLLRTLDKREGVASALNNIGLVYQSRGQHEKALSYFQKSLSLKRNIGDRRGIPRTLTNIGSIYHAQGRYEKALERHRTALRLKGEIGDRRGIANSLNDIGNVLRATDRLDEAASTYRRALRINREMGNRPSIARNLDNIGRVHLEKGRLATAVDTLEKAVNTAERLRLRTTSPDARRSLLATQIDAYRALTTAQVRNRDVRAALHSLERARARLLTDHLAGAAQTDTSFTIPPPSTLQQTLDAGEAALLYANVGRSGPLTGLVVTRDSVYGRIIPTAPFRKRLESTFGARLERLRQTEGAPFAAVRGQEQSRDEPHGSSLVNAVRLYRHQITQVDGADSTEQELGQRLYDLLLADLPEPERSIRRLVIVPTGVLGYLPFETLRDSRGEYVVERHHVRYAQSLTVLRQLRTRPRPPAPKQSPLLAIGGAAYGTDRPRQDGPLVATRRSGSTVRSRPQARALLQTAQKNLSRGRSPDAAYDHLGYQDWPALYGTKLEVQKLKRAVGEGTTLLSGQAASETRLRELSRSGALAGYRRLHFATHGIAVPEAPELSALVLSQVGASDSIAARDGYLTMPEIVELDLRADVAVLSACRTGIGRIVAGEGVVTLSHAFLRAGANATLVSQWRVLDWSTQQFMTSVYRTARDDDTSFAEAVTHVKREFIRGTFGARNADPIRWAPFVYYGRE